MHSTLFINLCTVEGLKVLLYETNNSILLRVKGFQVLLFNTNNSIFHYVIIFTQLNDSKYCYLLLVIQFYICYFLYTVKWSNGSIYPLRWTLLGTIISSQRQSGSHSNEGVVHVPQSFKNGASPVDSLVSYPGHSWVSYLQRSSQLIWQSEIYNFKKLSKYIYWWVRVSTCTQLYIYIYIYIFVCVCVCVRERESERETESLYTERQREEKREWLIYIERERERERNRETERGKDGVSLVEYTSCTGKYLNITRPYLYPWKIISMPYLFFVRVIRGWLSNYENVDTRNYPLGNNFLLRNINKCKNKLAKVKAINIFRIPTLKLPRNWKPTLFPVRIPWRGISLNCFLRITFGMWMQYESGVRSGRKIIECVLPRHCSRI